MRRADASVIGPDDLDAVRFAAPVCLWLLWVPGVAAEALRWDDDRLALALFAGVATPRAAVRESVRALFWHALAGAGVLVALGSLTLRERAAIVLQVAVAAVVLAWLARLR